MLFATGTMLSLITVDFQLQILMKHIYPPGIVQRIFSIESAILFQVSLSIFFWHFTKKKWLLPLSLVNYFLTKEMEFLIIIFEFFAPIFASNSILDDFFVIYSSSFLRIILCLTLKYLLSMLFQLFPSLALRILMIFQLVVL